MPIPAHYSLSGAAPGSRLYRGVWEPYSQIKIFTLPRRCERNPPKSGNGRKWQMMTGLPRTRRKKRSQTRAIHEALLSSPNLESAAASAKISNRTAWRWMRDATVLERLAQMRRHGMQHAMMRLQVAASAAVTSLCEVQQDGGIRACERRAHDSRDGPARR
jgi:hypothetical protein